MVAIIVNKRKNRKGSFDFDIFNTPFDDPILEVGNIVEIDSDEAFFNMLFNDSVPMIDSVPVADSVPDAVPNTVPDAVPDAVPVALPTASMLEISEIDNEIADI